MVERTQEDKAFLGAIEARWQGYVIAVGCMGEQCEFACDDDDTENHSCESSFSWSACDSCGSTLGGDRGKAQAFSVDPDKEEITEISLCVDCLIWHANGELPERWEG